MVRFVVQVRKMKDDSGQSLSRLAVKTGYSASSWERYLAGKTLPPAAAVEALATLVGADPVRIEALREAAAQAWPDQQPDGAAPDGQPEPQEVQEPQTVPWWSRPLVRTALTAGAGAVVGAAVTLLVVGLNTGGSKGKLSVTQRVPYTCAFTERGGQLFAGNSTTTSELVEVDDWGAKVAELQCLLQHGGFSPGAVDGNFGPLTESAVIRAQKADKLDVDGQVGPKTWAALRTPRAGS